VPIVLDESGGISLIRLEGDVNIAMAVEMKSLLLKALASGNELRVGLESATELDVTVLQLLYAAERNAVGAGIRFTVEGQVPKDISVAMADAGFDKFPIPMEPR
jgi:anti-anti-sigma regulatory factor